MPKWYTLYMSKGDKIKKAEGGMKIAKRLKADETIIIKGHADYRDGKYTVIGKRYHDGSPSITAYSLIDENNNAVILYVDDFRNCVYRFSGKSKYN